jgi:Zn-dependent protease
MRAARRIGARLSQAGRTRSGRWVWFGVSLLLFALVLLGASPAAKAVILVAVVLVHELGHYIGMRWFGYHDAHIFFIPLFGAATAGSKVGATPWQEAVVLLLGPLPGLVAGCVLWLCVSDGSPPLLKELALWLVAVNLLNLLPLEPLDGGRVVNLLLFYREPVLEGFLLAASALFLLTVSVLLLDSVILLVLAVAIMVQIPGRYRLAKAGRILARHWPKLPLGAEHLTETQLRGAFRVVLRCFPQCDRATAPVAMYYLLERAAIQAPAMATRGALLALYAGAIWLPLYVGVAAAVPATLFPPRPDWLPFASGPDQGPAIRRGDVK